MTESEIMKALECCKDGLKCSQCYCKPIHNDCASVLIGDALDLINRKNAEIAMLKREIPDRKYAVCVKVRNGMVYTKSLEDYDWLIGDISAEAIKEFAERLKKRKYQSSDWSHGEHPFVVEDDDIAEIAAEMGVDV